MSHKEFIFMLLGKTGSGKSSVGNSILNEAAFEASDSGNSATSEITHKNKLRSCYNITVIDTPGFMDTKVDDDKAKSKALEDMTKAMNECPKNGKISLILVLKYGDRYTSDSIKTMYILKNIFGEKYLKKSCIVVFTNGDTFEKTHKGKKSLKEWIKEQKDELGEFLKTFGHRCVLFSNLTKNETKQNKQFELLMRYAEELDHKYTLKKFEKGKKQQNRLQLESSLESLNERYNNDVDDLKKSLKECETLQELITLEEGIAQKIVDLNKQDTPEIIFYKEGENRFFDKIRNSFLELHIMISKKKEYIVQQKMQMDLNKEIEMLKQQIKKTDPQAPQANEHVNKFSDKFSQLEKKIEILKISEELKDNLRLNMTKAREHIFELENSIQKFNESEMSKKLCEIESQIKSMSPDSKMFDISEAEKINKILNGMDQQIKEGHKLKDLICTLKLIINQKILARKYNIEIENIMNKINDAIFPTPEALLPFQIKFTSLEQVIFKELSSETRDSVKLKDLKEKLLLQEHTFLCHKINSIDPTDLECETLFEPLLNECKRLKSVTKEYALTTFANKLKLTKHELKSLEDRAEKYKKHILEMRDILAQLNDLGIPCQINRFTVLSDRTNEVKKIIEREIQFSSDKEDLLKFINELGQNIYDKKVENDMLLGWGITRTITGALSVPAAFVPIVGPLISVGLNAIPLIGQAVHVKIENHRRRKQEKERAKRDRV